GKLDGCYDQRPEQPALAAYQQQELRVPLHAEQEGVVRVLDRMDDAVEVPAADLQLLAELVDGLVMQAVDLCPFGAEQLGEPATGNDIQGLEWQHGAAVGGFAALGAQLLVEVAAAAGVEQLGATADAQQGQPVRQGIIDDRSFQRIPLRVVF